jgi:hypothetical protein
MALLRPRWKTPNRREVDGTSFGPSAGSSDSRPAHISVHKRRKPASAVMRRIYDITARITRPTFSKISAICGSVTISGGAIASVSPVMRITRSSSWNARSIAS